MSARDRLMIVIVGAILATVGAWILVIGPKRDQASKLAGQVTAAQRQLDAARTRVTTADVDRTVYARNYKVIAELGEAVPSTDETPSLIFQLQNAATRARVDFLSVALNGGSSSSTATTSSSPPSGSVPAAPSSTPSAQPITVSFQGNFFHLANFLGRIARFVVATNKKISVGGRLMTVNGISFAAASGGFPQITATITATTYLLPASESLAAGASSAVPVGSSSAQTQPPGSASSPTPAATITPPAP